MAENWLPVLGYEGLYEASDLGRVRSVERKVPHRAGLMIVRERLLKASPNRTGYLTINLYRDGHRRLHRVHAVVASAFLGPRPDSLEVCHNNGNQLDNRLENLRYDTHSANIYDQVRDLTHPQAAKTHCPRGHSLVQPNLKPSGLKRNRRACLACNRAASYLGRRSASHEVFVATAASYYAQIMNSAA